jgi:hypothetical protein
MECSTVSANKISFHLAISCLHFSEISSLATVGCRLSGKELEPNWKMMMFERLGAPGEESSNGFNNAGTMACQTGNDEPIKIYQKYLFNSL